MTIALRLAGKQHRRVDGKTDVPVETCAFGCFPIALSSDRMRLRASRSLEFPVPQTL